MANDVYCTGYPGKAFPAFDAETLFSRLHGVMWTDQEGVYVRTALDSFRQEGFLHQLTQMLSQYESDNEVRAYVQQAETLISEAIVSRCLPNPFDGKIAAERVYYEIEQIIAIKSCLLNALQSDCRMLSGNTAGLDNAFLNKIYMAFILTQNKIIKSELPYVVRKNDKISQEYGTVYLQSQGLRIHIGPLADRIGLHTAYIGPYKDFGHIHSTKLAEHPNWEYHFVLPGQNGSHVVGQYRCDMDTVNGDIVGIPVDMPHGGFNLGDDPLELHFCAGGDIPWDYPPRDLSPHDVTQSKHTSNLGMVNGFSLKPSLEGLDEGIHTLFDPRKLGGSYGIELQAVVAGSRGVELESMGELVLVWSGVGTIEVADTTMKAGVAQGDKSSLLKGVRYRIISSGPKMIMLKFRMIDF
jgi:hypothetical protein